MTKDLKEILDFSNVRVLVVGDVMLDRYLVGNVERSSPEADVPILLQKEMDERLGGAANVAVNVKGLGADVGICGIIGEDEAAMTIIDLLQEQQINSDLIFHSPNRVTTSKTRVMKGEEHLLRVDNEDIVEIKQEVANKILKSIKAAHLFHPIDLIILQDYNKGLFSKNLIAGLIDFAHTHDILVTVDPKKKNFFSYVGVDLFKPNLKELCEAFQHKAQFTPEDVISLSERLIQKINPRKLLVTLSEHGSFYWDQGGYGFVPTVQVDHPDVCGAGDAVIALASLLLNTNLNFAELTEIVNTGGTLVCEEPGVVGVDKQKLLERLKK